MSKSKIQALENLFMEIHEPQKLAEEFHAKQQEIRDLETALYQHHQDLRRLSRSLQTARTETPNAAMVLEGIKQIERVKDVKIVDNDILIYTKTIYIRHGNKKYKIGKFLITISPARQMINIENLNRIRRGYHHPHIRPVYDEEGEFRPGPTRVCWGEISLAIPKLLASMMIPELVGVVIMFLQSYNHADPYINIDVWAGR